MRRATGMAIAILMGMSGCSDEPAGGSTLADTADALADVAHDAGTDSGPPPDDAAADVAADAGSSDTSDDTTEDTTLDALDDTSGDTALDAGDDTADAPDAPEPDTAGTDATDTTDTTNATDTPDATPDPPTDWEAAFSHVFPSGHVVDLHLTFAPGEWHALLLEWQTSQLKVEHPAAFAFDDESLSTIGVRLKGLNSLNVPGEGPIPLDGKYPLKLDFNTFGGPRFHKVDEVNLGINVSDPSLMRERLAGRLYEAMGVPASRSAYARLTIDGAYVGLYTMVQVIDKRFLKHRFGTANHADDGNLYKCLHNGQDICSLTWRGASKEDYIQTEGCAGGYEQCGLLLKTNEDDPASNDYADVIHFIDVLNNTPDDQFAAAIAEVFDVESFLRLSAVAIAIGNWDSYFGKGHNYYLYRRPDTGRFMMIPWDLDLTYEAPACSPDPANLDCWGEGERPLIQRLLAVPAYEEQFVAAMGELVANHLTVEQHAAWIAELDALIGDLVPGDPNKGPAESYEAATDPLGTGPENLHEWVRQRHDAIAPFVQ